MPPLKSIELDEYQAVNLLSALRASGVYGGSLPLNPMKVLNSGDWCGEIIQKLEVRLGITPLGSHSFQSTHYGHLRPNKWPSEYQNGAVDQLHFDKLEVQRLERINHADS